ncbi:hypothetical protein ACJX0J_006987 [Zea mays]
MLQPNDYVTIWCNCMCAYHTIYTFGIALTHPLGLFEMRTKWGPGRYQALWYGVLLLIYKTHTTFKYMDKDLEYPLIYMILHYYHVPTQRYITDHIVSKDARAQQAVLDTGKICAFEGTYRIIGEKIIEGKEQIHLTFIIANRGF